MKTKEKIDTQLFVRPPTVMFVEITEGMYVGIRGQVVEWRIDHEIYRVQFRKRGNVGRRQVVIEEIPRIWTKAF